jgi:hypothetical protein
MCGPVKVAGVPPEQAILAAAVYYRAESTEVLRQPKAPADLVVAVTFEVANACGEAIFHHVRNA